jgi:hypothetical protein
MISIKHSNYKIKEDPDLAFTRLNWTVERVDNLAGQMITSVTVNTNRAWVGVLEPEILKFRLIEPRGFFTINPVQLIVRGKIHQIVDGSRLEVRIQPGIYTFILFLGIYIMTAFMLFQAVAHGSVDSIIPGLIWTLIFPISGTIFLNYKVNQIDNKVKVLFGATEID